MHVERVSDALDNAAIQKQMGVERVSCAETETDRDRGRDREREDNAAIQKQMGVERVSCAPDDTAIMLQT